LGSERARQAVDPTVAPAWIEIGDSHFQQDVDRLSGPLSGAAVDRQTRGRPAYLYPTWWIAGCS
jgi:hypothetical protein